MLIRAALPEDLDAVVEHNRALAEETEGVELDGERLAHGVATALADPARLSYLLAELEGEPVGQLGYTREWSDWRDGEFLWLQSVYVRPEARRRGVFRALFRHFMDEIAADPSVCGVRLYMERENHAARATYRALGLAEADYVLMEQDRVVER